MLNEKLFTILTGLGACAESVEYLHTQSDSLAAVRGLRPKWRQWLAQRAQLPCWEAYKEAVNEAGRAPAWKAYNEARETAYKAYDEAMDGEILTWYYQII